MTNTLDQLIGSTAYDPAGNKIGKITTLYLDEHTAKPVWATVQCGLFGLTHSLVPVAGARTSGDSVILPVTREAVKDAPSIQAAGHLTPQQEAQLLRHYQIRSAGVAAESVAPPGQHPAPGHSATA